MFSCLTPTWQKQIEEFKTLVILADAKRASQLLVNLCGEFPLLAGIVTLLKQGSIDQALNNIAMFNRELAAELRSHFVVLLQISAELNNSEPGAGIGPSEPGAVATG